MNDKTEWLSDTNAHFDFAEDALLVSEKSGGDVVCHYVGREKALCYN